MRPELMRHEEIEETRHRILRVSAALFRESGYASVSMRRIAQACGMTAGSLYHHFPAKEDIVAEVLDLGIAMVHEAVAEALKETRSESAETRIRAAIAAHLSALLAHSDFTSANVRIFGQLPPDVRARNLTVRRRYERLWDRFLGDLRSRGDLRADVDTRTARLLVIGALNATLEWFDPKKGNVPKLADRYADLLLHGALTVRDSGR